MFMSKADETFRTENYNPEELRDEKGIHTINWNQKRIHIIDCS